MSNHQAWLIDFECHSVDLTTLIVAKDTHSDINNLHVITLVNAGSTQGHAYYNISSGNR